MNDKPKQEIKDIRKLIIPPELLKDYKSVFTFLKKSNNNITFWDDLIKIGLTSAQNNFDLNQKIIQELEDTKKELKENTKEFKQHQLADAIINLENAGYTIEIKATPNAKKE